MTKRAYQREERARYKGAALRLFRDGNQQPFSGVPNWLVAEFAGNRAKRLDLVGNAKKRWLAMAFEELNARIERLPDGKKYSLARGIKRREATDDEKAAMTITLDWLVRHIEEDEDGCWVWQGFITKGDQPQARISVGPGISATMLVRRLVARMKFTPSDAFRTADKFMANRQAGVKESCSPGCCHPDHIVMRTKAQAMKRRLGKPLTLSHRMRISAARRRNSKVSDEVIQQMMVDPRPGNLVASELGVHASYVPHVRTGKLRVYSTPGGSMFSALLVPSNGAFHDEEETA